MAWRTRKILPREGGGREGGGGATSWSWTGSFGVHFHSEDLFADIPPSSPLLPGGGTGKELPDQADTAGLQGLGIVGDWHPFQNGFRLSFAMYLDSNESGGFGTQKHPVPGIVADGPRTTLRGSRADPLSGCRLANER